MLKIALVERATHPYAVVRAAELRNWVDSGEYTQILAGTYPRRDEDGAASVSDAAKQAAAEYTSPSSRPRTHSAGSSTRWPASWQRELGSTSSSD